MPITDPRDQPAVVGVARRDDRFLVVRRAQSVIAPGFYCFCGGMCEPEEQPADALVREFAEELGLPISPLRQHWQSVTPWGVAVAWWSVDVETDRSPTLNLDEVDECRWLTIDELRQVKLLESNLVWLAAFERGEFEL